MRRVFAVLALAVTIALPAQAQIDSAPKVQARLVAEQDQVAPGATVTIALEENIRPGWHTYWRNPGDAGAPSEIQWSLPQGWQAGEIEWPYPKELPVGPLMDFGYEGKIWLLTLLHVPAGAKPGAVFVHATASWLVCKEVCIPEEAHLALPLNIGTAASPPFPNIAAEFAAARARLPAGAPWPATFAWDKALDLYIAIGTASHLAQAHFFPYHGGVIQGMAPQTLGAARNGVVLQLAPEKKTHPPRVIDGVLELISDDGVVVHAYAVRARPGMVPTATFEDSPGQSLPLALAFAFLGGLILNLMPCVLPILAMKALAIAGKSGKESRHAMQESLAYGLGAVLSFLVLGGVIIALRSGGHAIGWGFQLQEPGAVACFALLMFAVALNLSGVFEIPGMGAGQALAGRGGLAGAFFTGGLAVAVAAPCTAPFMAGALGYALLHSDAVALGVFAALGLGFALPFTAIGIWPGLRRLLPRPGAWMPRLRQLLAFPMYATALWLAWVLGIQSDMGHLIGLLVAAFALAFGLWVLGATQNAQGPMQRLGVLPVVLALVGLPILVAMLHRTPQAATLPALADIPSQSFTPMRLNALRAEHRPVFVNATAAWCVTCLVNERVALNDARVRAAFHARNVAYLVADWSRRSPDVSALLDAHGRDGVPLYLYYAPNAAEAKVLPQILTTGEILSTLDGH
jgi:thiol:disulfide interchange protein/DsbC/DsbD-like thiol-disulfide interchange protein